MFSVNHTTRSTSAASEALVPPAEAVRACTERQRRLTEYIRGHTGADIAVRLTPYVPTACVMPTSEETLVESDNADLSSKEAQQLADSVDADYLVLISTAPATVDRLPISDQPTADRAQQFGYALHELGHIRYTAIADAATLLEERVNEEHQEFVHGLWNSCEDAAIENQLAADQSQLAADRLEIVNRSISTLADEFTPDQQAEFSFRDGIETALYDRGIYETGACERLCDPDDDQFVFATDADRQAFASIDESIDDLLATILTTPDSTDRAEVVLEWWDAEIKPLLPPSDQDEKGGEQEGEDGAQGEDSASNGQSQDNTDQQGEPSTGQQSEQVDGSDQTTGGDEESPPDSCPDSTGEGEDGGESESGEAGGDSETHPDPSDITTDQRQETPGTDALEYPDVGDGEDAEALREPGNNADTESETSEVASASQENDGNRGEDPGPEAETETGTETETSTESESSEGNGDQGDPEDVESSPEDAADGSESATDSSESASRSTDGDGEDSTGGPTSDDGDDRESGSEGENGEDHSSDSPSPASAEANPWTGSDGSSQTSLGSFAQVEGDSDDSGSESPSQGDGDPARDDEETPPEDTTSDSSATSDGDPDQDGRGGVEGSGSENNQEKEKTNVNTPDTQDDSENGAAGEVGNSEPSENDQPERSDAETGTPDTSEQNEEPTNSEHEDENSTELSQDGSDSSQSQEAEPLDQTPAHEDTDLGESDALDTDRDGARDEAERSSPDETQLEQDLEDVAAALNELEGEDGGADAAPGSLDELSIMPNTTGVATDQSTVKRWNEADADAGYVADALRKALKESRRTGNRSGLTSGSFDRRRAGALARGEVNAFQVRQPGEQKQYDLVLILDRSRSMRTQINTAENALVRFAVACEDVGINVGIVDFYDDEARLIKPFSVETQYVQPSLFSKEYSGGTPLADALGIGRELLEQRRNSPLVIVVTDGKPGDADAYQNQLARSYAPICGLTLSLGTSKGNVPDRVANNERFYDRHLYVHDSDRITNRLDQFAVMFDGL